MQARLDRCPARPSSPPVGPSPPARGRLRCARRTSTPLAGTRRSPTCSAAWRPGPAASVERLANFGLDAPRIARDGTSATGPVARAWRNVRFVLAAPADATRLVLGMDAARVRAGLELPAAQAEPRGPGCRTPRARSSSRRRSRRLPEQFTMGALERPGRAPRRRARRPTTCGRCSTGSSANRRDRCGSGGACLASSPLEHAALLDEQLADAIVALAQVFALAGRRTSRAESARDGGGRAPGRGSAGEAALATPRRAPTGSDGRRRRARPRRARSRARRDPAHAIASGRAEPETPRSSRSPRRARERVARSRAAAASTRSSRRGRVRAARRRIEGRVRSSSNGARGSTCSRGRFQARSAWCTSSTARGAPA